MSGRPINEDRQNAIALGLRTYMGAPHSKCGTTERYVSGGGCVYCARETATAQREALKAVRAQASTALDEKIEEQIINHDELAPIDNGQTPEQITFEQSIEDLL